MAKSKATKPTPEQQVKDLTRERDRIQAELTATQQELGETRGKAAQVEEARISALEAVRRAEERKTSLAGELLQARTAQGELDTECVKLRQEAQSQAANIAALDNTIAELRTNLDSYKAAHATVVGERDSARKLKWLWIALLVGALIFAAVSSAHAQATASYAWDDPHLSLHVPQEVLQKFRNPDGSCVQCSNAMTGTDQNVPEFAYLLWDSEYGKKVRGGSSPSRVANYAKERGVRVWNVTGKKTYDWMKWACATGRGAAIGAGGNHFQTLVGHDPVKGEWFVVNNNGDQRIQVYNDAAFHRLHEASGNWCVILDYPCAPGPAKYFRWWEEYFVDAANPPPTLSGQ